MDLKFIFEEVLIIPLPARRQSFRPRVSLAGKNRSLDSSRYVDYCRHMDINHAVQALGALSQESRLKAFRLLIRSGSDGMAAGAIARELDIPHNTLSTHLAILHNAGLVHSRRESRSIIYNVDFEGTRGLLAFLMEECCQGSPEICVPVLDSLMPGCYSPSQSTGESNETPAR